MQSQFCSPRKSPKFEPTTRPTSRFLRSGCISALVGIVLLGCGGDRNENRPRPRPTSSNSSESGVKPVTLQPKGGDVAQSGAKQASAQRGTGSAESAALPHGVSPEDLFRASESDHEWTSSPTPHERDTFILAMAPRPGHSADTFVHPHAARRSLSDNRPAVSVPVGPASPRTDSGPGAAALPEGFKAVAGAVAGKDGFPARIVNEADGSEMVLIPAGTFFRGSRNGPANTRPRHKVYLDAFYIALHEVTLKQFAAYEDALGSDQRRRSFRKPLNVKAPLDHPALGVTYLDADAYATWAKCSLPTEAQWEKAARGPDGAQYAWGDGRPVWSRARSRNEVQPVKYWRTDVSYYGLFDMAGNAREWCLDLYVPDIYQEAGEQGELLLENPANRRPRRGVVDRVIRGGAPGWQVWYRESGGLSAQLPDVGFRCVLNLPSQSSE
jgi:formylglycine-generating enzyme